MAEVTVQEVADRPAMLTVQKVARLLGCSARTVYRLADSGRMPRPVKLSALVRWSRQEIEQWVASGCPKVGKEGQYVGK